MDGRNDGPSGSAQRSSTPAELARALETALHAELTERPGTHIGPYKLLQRVGEGGFGEVWMAEQEQPIHRRVALKIIKRGMDTKEVVARFDAERQALALMEHPNIAQVFDAGATGSGRPYFVMELVRGIPITHYCDEARMPAESRLRLFIAVCQAVQHAHQKGVLHRDLKPSNILVTLHDSMPVPKIIDFGIAKATSAHLTDKTLITQVHAFVGTPVYTSPEQMEMSGIDVDTRSDIYSLGVLLYELLAGRPPFDSDALARAGLEAMRRTIREVNPPRPSHRLDTLPEPDRAAIAHQRSTEAAKLALQLRGDVDWIVMHCLEKDRTRRYETAAALAADLRHHLHREPIAARPPNELYRLGKFIQRHRVGVAALAVIVLSLLAGLVASSALLVREHAARQRALAAEQSETLLRLRAEEASTMERKRAVAATWEVANRRLVAGDTADGLAHLVHAGRLDPTSPLVAPRLASVLASHEFLLPEGEPLQVGPGIMGLNYVPSGGRIEVFSESGTFASTDLVSGRTRQLHMPTAVSLWTNIGTDAQQVGILGRDGVVRTFDRAAARLLQMLRFETPVLAVRNMQADPPSVLVLFEDQSIARVDPVTGETRPLALEQRTSGVQSWVHGGRWLVVHRPPGRLQLWDPAAGELVHTARLDGQLNSAVIDAGGTRLATITTGPGRPAQPVLTIWTLPDLQPLPAAVPIEATPEAGPTNVKFTADGRRLLAWNPAGRQVYDSATGDRLGPFFSSTPIIGPAGGWFSPEGARLAGLVEGGLQVFEIDTGRELTPLMPHPGELRQVEFSRDGALLLTTCSDGIVRLWDATTGRLVAQPIVQDTNGVFGALSPDGTRLVVGTASGGVHQFRVENRTARPITLPRRLGAPRPAPFLPDLPPRMLWLGPDRARVFDVASGLECTGGFTYPESIGSPSDNQGPVVRHDLGLMIVYTRDHGWRIWMLGASGIEHAVPLVGAPEDEAWACLGPDGRTVALIASTMIRFWDTRTGLPVGRPCVAGGGFFTPDAQVGGFTPDGLRFVAGADNGKVTVWAVSTGKPVLQLGPNREGRFSFVGYSPDGSRIATVQNSLGDVRLWDAASGQPVGPVRSSASGAGGAAFSTDGRRFAASLSHARVVLWDTRDGTPVLELPVRARSLRFSPDDRCLVTTSSDMSAQCWDVATGQPLAEPMIHTGQVVSGAFSPDARFLCTEAAGGKTSTTAFYLWPLPPEAAGTPVPEWLLQLATAVAGRRIDESGRCIAAPEALGQLNEVRQTLAALPADAPYAEWGRWILASGPSRPIAPGFTLTPEAADALTTRLAAETPVGTPPWTALSESDLPIP